MKKAPVILVVFAAILLLSATVLADVTWKTLYPDKRTLAQANTLGTEWGYTFPTYPRILHRSDGVDLGGDLGKNQGLQLYVVKPGGSERVPIIEIYTGTISLWSGGSYFVIKGASIYSNFPEQKYTLDNLVEKFGENNVYNKINPYYFPSEDRKIFKLEIEVDTSGVLGNELIVHKVYLEDQATFANDLENYFKSDGKVPVGGTGLKLTPSTFNKATTKKIEFEFISPEDSRIGYTISIMSEPVSSDDVEDLLKKLEVGSLSGSGFILFQNTDRLNENQEAKGTIEGISKIETLQDLDNGKYLVFADKIGTPTTVEPLVGAILTIEGEKPATPCDECETILECLACVDQTFIKGVFK